MNCQAVIYFEYLQIQNYVRTFLPQFQNAKPNFLDKCLIETPSPKQRIATIYNLLGNE